MPTTAAVTDVRGPTDGALHLTIEHVSQVSGCSGGSPLARSGQRAVEDDDRVAGEVDAVAVERRAHEAAAGGGLQAGEPVAAEALRPERRERRVGAAGDRVLGDAVGRGEEARDEVVAAAAGRRRARGGDDRRGCRRGGRCARSAPRSGASARTAASSSSTASRSPRAPVAYVASGWRRAPRPGRRARATSVAGAAGKSSVMVPSSAVCATRTPLRLDEAHGARACRGRGASRARWRGSRGRTGWSRPRA